ncbi:hypothetical protein [Klebsiella phage Kpn17]|uniref:Uncharacterized protein n=1 Tax=Klebsiella phage Kpn17 TaxID=3044025 RepID=A0AAT9V660_9CAUD|nr:hypothetical protein [Klebsiella phage Kpn17]
MTVSRSHRVINQVSRLAVPETLRAGRDDIGESSL